MQRKHWNILQPSSDLVRQLSVRLDISTTLATILANRNITSAEKADSFLHPSLNNLNDPFLMMGMERAVRILASSLGKGENILVFGDYDVDGVTGTALLVSFLRRFTERVSYYIPHRVEEGYGLQSERIRRFAAEGGDLVLTVDCGISHFAEVEEGRALGLTFIITDHHEPPDKLPPADVILNPRQKNCPYPFKHLAGVGIAFKLIQGLAQHLKEHNSAPASDTAVFDCLDLVALGTVADIVPLQDENRILVRHGMERLNKPTRTGLTALKNIAGLGSRSLKTSHIAFALGPRINAAGRLGTADIAVDLLLEEDRDCVTGLADQLNQANRRRQQIEANILREALEILEKTPSLLDDRVLVLSSPGWHSGVIGIVASKIAERYSRPSILISTEGDICKGSARSIKNFDLFSCLQQCQHLFETFGGHSYAAGLSIQKDLIQNFRQKLNALHMEAESDAGQPLPLNIDAAITFGELRTPLLAELSLLMPFGYTNPAPTFVTEGVHIARSPRMVGKNHLRLSLSQKPHIKQAIGFNMGDFASSLSRNFAFNVAYSIDLDPYVPGGSHQLRLCDIQFPYSFDPPHAVV